MSPHNAASTIEPQGWSASLRLGFEPALGKTILRQREQRGPLAVQRTFHPEKDVCHLYLLHPPGGVVGGDTLMIDARTRPGSSALITTPGATKFYRSNGPLASQTQRLELTGSTLEWFPQENIYFPGANVRLESNINLDRQSHYFGWEIHSFGRPSLQEPFDAGRLDLRMQVQRDGRPLYIDRLVITGDQSQHGAATQRNSPVTATFLATGATKEDLACCRELLEITDKHTVGVTLLDDLLVARYLGYSTAIARQLFVQLWSALRPTIMNRKAVIPRIWAT